jgi:hypothetical protein
MTDKPDIFANVHRGIRKALFDLCLLAGRTEPDEPEWPALLAQAEGVLHFVAHHGENEDVLLLPALRERVPEIAGRIAEEHRGVEQALGRLRQALATDARELFFACCSFTSLYLDHMRFEELECLPVIHAHFSIEELLSFGARSVARTRPEDQSAMLGYMFAAMSKRATAAFLEQAERKMPAEAFAQLTRLAIEHRPGGGLVSRLERRPDEDYRP